MNWDYVKTQERIDQSIQFIHDSAIEMASKGKNVKLQTEIGSTEELSNFLNQYRDSLLRKFGSF